MAVATIEQEFRAKVGAKISLVAEGDTRYVVLTPFRFDDGDHLVIVLRHLDGAWFLTDEGHTFMHLTYKMDEQSLRHGSRHEFIAKTLAAFGVEDRDGQLVHLVRDSAFDDAFFSFVQALIKVTTISCMPLDERQSESPRFA